MKQVAIVILNWNGVNWLEKFLPTLIRNSDNQDIYIADNASTDNSVEYIKENFKNIFIIKNDSNGGFAKGYNDALNKLEGKYKYYLIINSDIEVTPDFLAPLVQTLEDGNNLAGVQPKIKSYTDKKYFEYAGSSGGFIDNDYFPFCRGRIFDQLEKDIGQYDFPMEVFWTSGACMLIKTDAFHQLSGFDEDFFAHMEEIDLCWRAQLLGYKFMINPKSIVYHVGGGTLNYGNPRKTFLNFRNNLFMIHKNHQGILFTKIFKRLVLDGIAGIKFFVSGQFKHTFAIIKAHFAYYGNLRQLNKKRTEILRASTTNKNNSLGGFYDGSILFNYFIKRNKTFDKLNKRKLT